MRRSRVLCCISLETKPESYFPHCTRGSALTACFIVLAGLFKQIAKVLLRAIEWQVTRKVCSLTLADHSKALCPR